MTANSATYQRPFTFRNGITLKNKIVLAPMTNCQSLANGDFGEMELTWLKRRAVGQFGVLISAAAHVSEDGQGFPGEIGCFADRHVDALRPFAEVCQQNQALGIIQLFHAGTRAPRALTGVQPKGPSAVHPEYPGSETPRALTESEIQDVITAHVAAAKRCMQAGLGGVEVDGANGYLLTQFLSEKTNVRKDIWGGSWENRARLFTEITREVRKVIPSTGIVGVTLQVEDTSSRRGFDIDDGVQLAVWLAELGIDYVHISANDALTKAWKYPETQLTITAVIRRALPEHVALIAGGGVTNNAQADAVFGEGADLIALAKAAIIEPDWPIKAQDPTFLPKHFPVSREELESVAVSAPFIEYLGQMGLVRQS